MRRALAACLAALWLAAPGGAQTDTAEDRPDGGPAAGAQPARPEARSLDELLRAVREGLGRERAENRQREREFEARKDEQARLLARAREDVAALERRSASLETDFETNERQLAELEVRLEEKLGNLGELFGVVRQVAGEAAGNLEASPVSAQFPGRHEALRGLAQSRALPSIEKLEELWYALQQEMTASGKVVRFAAPVIRSDGEDAEQPVIRAGVFTVFSQGRFLRWLPETQRLTELARQPGRQHLATARRFAEASDGFSTLCIDPSRGAILQVLGNVPTLRERVEQGGVIGYAILALGLAAGAVGIVRLVQLAAMGRRVKAQRSTREARADNPLGRVLAAFEANRDADVETLELSLEEAILGEATRMERFLWLIRVGSVVAPLMGLLGTVTGMIRTFQVMTLFGTGDPKLMAGGISEALVTTMLGLCVAIPLVLLHSVLASISRGTVEVLEKQSAGLVAARARESGA